jgi:clorobiocin biosynthesis protein CloN6
MVASIQADCVLLHAPSVFDFRNRDDLLFAYLSDSDSVNVTSVFEMYPLGFLALKAHLEKHGAKTEIVNLASIMLKFPDIDVERLIAHIQTPLIGIDLHWAIHCHGSIEVARLIKKIHPDTLIMFGGISATYFAEELIGYEGVDFVVQGYDTLEPVRQLVQQIRTGNRQFETIPNLLFKRNGQIVRTGFEHKPERNYNNTPGNFSYYGKTQINLRSSPMIMTLPNSGCAMNCGWCGGSRYAFRRIMGTQKPLIQRDIDVVIEELQSLGDAAQMTGIYALQCYSETKARLHKYFDAVRDLNYRMVSIEQFHLTPDDTLKKLGECRQPWIMLSPESHDMEISKLAGRGTYTMEEMEAWIPRALDHGVGVVIWFFIGMPKQSQRSVLDMAEYCIKLVERFGGKKVIPALCPMVPFLDPGSQFFEEPEAHGYRVFYRGLEEHRKATVMPVWSRRLNYETTAMTRQQIQDVTYDALERLIVAKGQLGVLPDTKRIVDQIHETKRLLAVIEGHVEAGDPLPHDLRKVILAYNAKILSYSSDQLVPAERPLFGRWFDDYTVPQELIDACRERPVS